MFNWENYKGLRWYIVVVLVALSFFAYSQSVGWMWMGATNTTPPADETGTHGTRPTGYRYYHHK